MCIWQYGETENREAGNGETAKWETAKRETGNGETHMCKATTHPTRPRPLVCHFPTTNKIAPKICLYIATRESVDSHQLGQIWRSYWGESFGADRTTLKLSMFASSSLGLLLQVQSIVCQLPCGDQVRTKFHRRLVLSTSSSCLPDSFHLAISIVKRVSAFIRIKRMINRHEITLPCTR